MKNENKMFLLILHHPVYDNECK